MEQTLNFPIFAINSIIKERKVVALVLDTAIVVKDLTLKSKDMNFVMRRCNIISIIRHNRLYMMRLFNTNDIRDKRNCKYFHA